MERSGHFHRTHFVGYGFRQVSLAPIMMREIALFILLLISVYSPGQERRLLSFDLMSKETDTLEIPEFDSLLIFEKTSYNMGRYNQIYENLDTRPPTEDVFEGAHFTLKKQASKDYDINNFPIRTSVKLFRYENDSLKSLCSGSMISRKHVLTACHCVAKGNQDTISYDSLFVCPVLDNGDINSNFDCSWVKKIVLFENWSLEDTDISVLELETPIGENTGWISIGFNANDSSLLDGIFYKFTYPGITMHALDPNNYNGDTLYYNFGIADYIREDFLGVKNATGIPCESGSSIIKVENEKSYTSYGVLSWSRDIKHSRITNWKYYALKSVIISDLGLTSPETNFYISVFPNPTANYLNIICTDGYNLNKIVLYDMMGKNVLQKTNIEQRETQIDLSGLIPGQYILTVHTGDRITIKKVIKNGH